MHIFSANNVDLLPFAVLFFTFSYVFSSAYSTSEKLYLFLKNVPPTLHSGSTVIVLHSCFPSWRVVGAIDIQLTPSSYTNYVYKAFSSECAGKSKETLSSTNVTLHLPPYFGCRPQYWLERPPKPHRVRLRLWLEDSKARQHCSEKLSTCYRYARERISYATKLPEPRDRLPCLQFADGCASGFHLLRAWSWRPNRPRICAKASEYQVLLKFPVFFGAEMFSGIVNELPKITNSEFKKEMKKTTGFHKFTLSLWVYIAANCSRACSILHGLKFHKTFAAPLLLLSSKRELQIHLDERSGDVYGDIVFWPLPLRTWLQIIVAVEENSWKLYVYDRKAVKLNEATVNISGERNFSTAERSSIVIGGSEAAMSLHGLVGEAVIFRGYNPPVHRILGTNTDSPMFTLKVTPTDVERDCQTPVGQLNSLLLRASARLKMLLEKDRCVSNNPLLLMRRRALVKPSRRNGCRPEDAPVPNWSLYVQLRHLVFTRLYLKHVVGLHLEARALLYASAKEALDAGHLEDLRQPARLLRSAHCLGDTNATFLLSLIHSYGLGRVHKNTTEATRLLLTPRPHQHRLLNLAAGHKLLLGINGAPLVPEHAFLFHERVARTTHLDFAAHMADDVSMEKVRLTNERQMKEQTDEEGDLFHWIKHQAEQNVPWAKRRLAHIWYWGSQGIARDLTQAATVLEQNANAADAEPSDSLEYGMVLLKGQGRKKDVATAKKHFQRAADKGNPYAVNALAWAAERYDKNYTRAVELYQQAHAMGCLDATYNLGIVFHSGTFPGIPIDYTKAFQYFQVAALRGGTHAGYMYSFYLQHGVPGIVERNEKGARDWVRFIAEQNVKTGKLLSTGTRAFRKKEWKKSFINFVQAAYCGLEIANFNLAVLCEDHKSDFPFLAEECAFFHYNLSIQRPTQLTDGHAHLKMGDCFWFGCQGSRKSRKTAIAYYNTAALQKKMPQAFFNLGYIAEKGYKFSRKLLQDHKLQHLASSPDPIERHKFFLASKFFQKCESIPDSDALLPCQLARMRLEMWLLFLRYNVVLTFLVATVVFVILLVCWHRLRAR